MEESISLEETNKIRISLGLKPLTDDSAPSDDKEKQAEDNYAKQRERQVKERETKYLHGSFLSMRLVLIDASLFQTNIRPDSQVSFSSLYWLFGLSQWLLLTIRNHRVRNRRELHASLKGATLGDPDGDTEDTLKWIKKAKKRDKELAAKRQQELENLDKAFQGDDYTESACSSFNMKMTCLIVYPQRTWLVSKSAMTSKTSEKAMPVFSH
jgi:U4/U6.U5 tri-snRNP-associated protein 1